MDEEVPEDGSLEYNIAGKIKKNLMLIYFDSYHIFFCIIDLDESPAGFKYASILTEFLFVCLQP